MNYQPIGGLDGTLAALANPQRRRMVELLSVQPASIQQLAQRVGLSLPAIHRHIAILESAGLVRRMKSGRVNFLALRRLALRELQAWMGEFALHWGSDEETLENYVAGLSQTAEATSPPK